jgi:hypothetical protein
VRNEFYSPDGMLRKYEVKPSTTENKLTLRRVIERVTWLVSILE